MPPCRCQDRNFHFFLLLLLRFPIFLRTNHTDQTITFIKPSAATLKTFVNRSLMTSGLIRMSYMSGRSGFPGNNITFSQSVSATFSGSSHKLKFSAYAHNYLVANQDLKGRMVALERTKGPSGRPGVEPPTGEVHNPKQREITSNRCSPESGRWASAHRPHPGDV